jgi:tetratricopeptide (TPR) repeat protein
MDGKGRMVEAAGAGRAGFLARPALHFLLIIIIGAIAYSGTLNVPFVFDDKPNITENPIIRDFGYFADTSRADGLDLGIMRRQLNTRYIAFLSFWANYRLGGLHVSGYHIVNLAIHLTNAVLAYLLVRLTFMAPVFEQSSLRKRSQWTALFTGLLFVSHPVQTEAVTYITQRSGELAAMFYLLSAVLYVRSRLSVRGASKYGLYALSLVSAVLAMKSKETAFTLPIALALHEFMFFRGGAKRRIIPLVPFLLAALMIPIGHAGMDEGGLAASLQEATRLQTGMPRSEYLYTQFRVVLTYIRLLFIPVNQNIDYDYPVYNSFFKPQAFLSFLFLLSLLVLSIRLICRPGRKRPDMIPIAFGVLWFLTTLSVESSIIPIPMLINEYRVYLPSAGAFLALASGMFVLLERLGGRAPKAFVISLLLLLPLILTAASHARNSAWKSEIALWEDVARKSPWKARPHNNLGTAYMEAGRTEKALLEFWTTVTVDPDFFEAYANLGVIYREKGLEEKAVEILEYSLALNPGFAEAHNSLGLLYGGRGEDEKAKEHFLRAIAARPGYAEAHINLAIAYESLGRPGKAEAHYKAALGLDPGSAVAHNNLGLLYQARGLEKEAKNHYLKAIYLEPEYAEAHNNLGLLFYSQGYTGHAEERFLEAASLKPGLAEAHFNLGVLYMKEGLTEAARTRFRKTLELRPDDPQAGKYLDELQGPN